MDVMTLTPMQELDEIDWTCGLIPMPEHLVRLGTKIITERYIAVRNPDTAPMVAKFLTEETPVQYNPNEWLIQPNPTPRQLTYVWGELTSITSL